MIELVGVIGAGPEPLLASTFAVYNQLYGNKIPIGSSANSSDSVVYSDGVKKFYSNAIRRFCYTNPNATIDGRFGTAATRDLDDVPGSVEVYRRLLSEADDLSITIYAAGQLFNFPALFRSPPDEFSPLRGEELVRKKVEQFVFMGGYFPASYDFAAYNQTGHAEWNWYAFGDSNVTKSTLETIAGMMKPMTYVGFEVGLHVRIGAAMVERLGRDHPTSEAFFQYRAIYDSERDELIKDNPAFDEIALFHLVEGGLDVYFDRVHGRVQVDEHGANRWIVGSGSENYIVLRAGVAEELKVILTNRLTGVF
jgi:hypothetical protein